jgi:hypothetical protein
MTSNLSVYPSPTGSRNPGKSGPNKEVLNPPSNRFSFTQTRLATLPIPEKDRVTYHDTACPGLSLRVSSNGILAFTVMRRMNGRPSRVTVGRFPDISVEIARREAQQIMGKIAGGINPAQEKRAIRRETTVNELFADYLELHAKAHKKTWQEDERRFKSHIAQWGNRRLSEITTPEIQSWHGERIVCR